MGAFEDARTVEAESLVALRPFLEETQGRFVLTDKGRLARFLQAECGDLMLNDKRGNLWAVELKAERRFTGNLFLETWSNRNLEDADNHARVGNKRGWLDTTRADLLFYHFLDADRLYILNTFRLKQWAFRALSKRMVDHPNGERRQGIGRIYDFFECPQAKYAQRNDTRGVLVPISVLNRELAVPPKEFSVRQLQLDLLEGEPALT